MKIEMYGKDNYKIFINRKYMNNVDFLLRDDIVKFIKEYLFRLKQRLKLCGFYKIKVFLQDKIGVFLDVIKLDESEFYHNLDLRIVVYFDEKIYFETDDYFLIDSYNDRRYFDGYFYCLVDAKFDKLLEMVEFGRFIYGKEVNNLLNNSVIL